MISHSEVPYFDKVLNSFKEKAYHPDYGTIFWYSISRNEYGMQVGEYVWSIDKPIRFIVLLFKDGSVENIDETDLSHPTEYVRTE